MIRTVEWKDGRVVMIDQRLLPGREVYRVYDDDREVARAIRDMVIRGAPAIGVAAAMGVALAARRLSGPRFREELERACERLVAARPTGVNLRWAVERMRRAWREVEARGTGAVRARLEAEARAIHREDVAANRRLGRFGAGLLPDEATVLTHCNAGALATAGYGTALGIVRAARAMGKRISVVASETRPFLQGARLTAWELVKDRIPCTLVADSMVGALMQSGRVQAVVVGTDRTARNGDVANKIGTYTVAVLAARHGVPFYVAAPSSSIDLACADGDGIPIEERAPDEVTRFAGAMVAPRGVAVWNPAFDVTPAKLVTAIVTERGVAARPYGKTLPKLLGEPNANAKRRSAS
jgi:methylthioribose-1-phosphate isomerase